MTNTKPDARQRFITHVLDNGWILDPTAQRRNRFSDVMTQDPHVFLRPAAHGGTWRLKIEFNRDSVVLRELAIAWTGTDLTDIVAGKPVEYDGRTWTLGAKPRASWREALHLWTALETQDDDAKERTLRQRAELLAIDPDTAVWLAIQVAYDQRMQNRKATALSEALRERKARPLPLVEGTDPWKWRTAAYAVLNAADKFTKANGTTDLLAVIAETEANLAALKALIDPEAAKARAELLAGEPAL